MNTHARHAVTARLSYGTAVKWCVALACAAYAYGLLEPAATARASLDACVNENLEQHSSAAGAASATSATPTAEEEREQAVSAAVYACSTQP
ncbi:hypothetical protein [Paraburkholderia nemoris]|uniref:hypothetical protein n=1 Tax=Paraburkholderia nemoris TaxID=2793076 RepID=UPI001B0EA8C9|nr:hypothetical protein [Paraburkholderia nemoris]CAE6813781.1 hypothetical protein LMG22931_06003 [Paraburkholderia nemoris]